MGQGYGFTCEKCNHQYDAFIGGGFLYTEVYKEMLSDIKAGKYGIEWKQLYEDNDYVAVSADKHLFICDDCGNWIVDKDISLYVPKDINSVKKMEFTIDCIRCDNELNDILFRDAGVYVINCKKASVGTIQRHFKLGFVRAERILNQLKQKGVVVEDGMSYRIMMELTEFESRCRNDKSFYDPENHSERTDITYIKQTVEELGYIPYVMEYEIKENFKILKRKYHQCSQCGKRMHRAKGNEFLALKCPKCGADNECTRFIKWD